MSTMTPDLSGATADPTWKIAIVRSLWHGELTQAMAGDAHKKLMESGMNEANVLSIECPGSFELPLLCKTAIQKSGVHGVIAFGIVVQGDTHHARMVAENAARALMDVQMNTGVPVTFELLFVNDMQDARERATGPGAKGALAAQTLLTTLAKLRELQS